MREKKVKAEVENAKTKTQAQLHNFSAYMTLFEDTLCNSQNDSDEIAVWWASLFKASVQWFHDCSDELNHLIHNIDNPPMELSEQDGNMTNALIHAFKARCLLR